ncbi:eukaryotic translation initiation factor 4B-like [Euwallacea similis]|uniref:eukaryotic translation initiation factor 4B-like n=1 Tax=Euwallacea similis TaxID=1736056 RepID=UPI00344BCC77
MASGKKSKKTKGKTLALTDFLQESSGTLPSQPIRKSTTSWADEVDEYDSLDPKTVNVVLPTAPKASRDYEDIENKVPKEPPFMAYLSNLPYDVDEEEIADFFRNMKISNMRIPKDDRPGEVPKLKGFGYIEFEDRESLMSALILPDTNLKNRRIRIEVASNSDNDRRRGRMGDQISRTDTGGDWRSTNRPELVEERRGGGFNRDRDAGGSGGGAFTREGMREPTRDREYGGFSRDREGGFNRDRDFGRDREGFNRNRDQDRPGAWRDGDRSSSYNKDRGYARGNYRDSDRNSSRFEREDRDDRRGGYRRYDDNERNDGSFGRRGDFSRREEGDSEATATEPRQRPKLNLAPRTKPLEQIVKPEPAVPSASIFGNAKPVDTAERERQIEEKLLKEQEERLRESSKDREKERAGSRDHSVDRGNIDRGRPAVRRDERERGTNSRDKGETNNRDRGPPSRERRNASDEDSRRSGAIRNDHKSPENRKKVDKQEKSKREEKRERPEKEMPKFQEPEVPNFQASNKFALLDDDDD